MLHILGHLTVRECRARHVHCDDVVYCAWFACLVSERVHAQAEASSYREIALALGADSPAQLLFATDVEAEAAAATTAGWQVCQWERESICVYTGAEFQEQ